MTRATAALGQGFPLVIRRGAARKRARRTGPMIFLKLGSTSTIFAWAWAGSTPGLANCSDDPASIDGITGSGWVGSKLRITKKSRLTTGTKKNTTRPGDNLAARRR